MIDALYIAASGLRSEQKQIDVISHNVANMQTPGFKRGQVNFADVAAGAAAGEPNASVVALGSGARVMSTTVAFEQGTLRPTQRALDVAIQGNGFLELEAEDGRRVYTRDGQLRVSAEGYLVSLQGLKVSPVIQIPPDAGDVRIAGDGEVTAQLAGEAERRALGMVELAAFPAPDALQPVGDNLFAAPESAGGVSYGRPGEEGFGVLHAGYVEQANVDMIQEMSSLVVAQRAYQLNARLLQASDQILETINNLRR